MPKSGTFGSVRGVSGNGHSYRDRIEFDPDAARELRKLDRPVQQRLLGFLRLRVAPLEDPRAIGEALAGQRLGAFWKYRVGDWRLICDIQDERIVVRVLRVGHRREACR